MTSTKRVAISMQPGVIRLDSGDPDFLTPEPIRRAHADALERGLTHYSDSQGNVELRHSIAERLSATAGSEYSADQIVVTHGATGALMAVLLAAVGPDDGVILPEPTYSLYGDLVRMAGGRPIEVPTVGPEFRLDPDRIAYFAAAAKVIVLCHPCNPTGVVHSREEILEVANIAARHNLLVIVDEAYDHIVFDPAAFVSSLEIEELRPRLAYVQTFSKTYAMTGWRIGYVAAPAELARAAARIHRTANGPLNAAVQQAALVALGIDERWSREMLLEYSRRREMVTACLADSAGTLRPPAGTFYAFIGHPPGMSSTEMVSLALEHGVSLRPGSEYGASGEGFVRLAFSASRDDLVTGLDRLRQALNAAQKSEPSIGAIR